jgi:DNA-binding NtrC family response regulator
MIENALRAVGGDKDRAANALGLRRQYLVRKIRQFGIDLKAFEEPSL